MLKKYIVERIHWILLFFFIQLLFLLIVWIDHSIPFHSVFYIIFLSLLVFVLFFAFRYQKETKFYKQLGERMDDLDTSSFPVPESPFEKIVENHLTSQTDQLKRQASHNWLLLEQEKDDLLTWIHEVKTPLTAMYLIIERLEDEKIKADLTYEWLRIHLLLDQQLHQKRIPFMENDLYIEPVCVEMVVVKEIQTLRTWCMRKGIGFDLDFTSTTVLSDAKWLAFIIRQLLTNAVKYSESSDITIRSKEKNGQTVLTIQDFGRGIDAKDIPRIFEKGFTSTTTHQDNAATGMGLYLTKKVVTALLIDIHVQSSLGKGTIFTLTFPKQNDFTEITSM
ncbi:sensor histidine kinase [Massilibacterium senegalense]|uniref:sensor histidine kinase n=1 Tax=Massilibacterium senegalense TaxID=1632858 RepID=UPI000783792E|nr:sensor histidine kinase [Massilibacterium senegalense]